MTSKPEYRNTKHNRQRSGLKSVRKICFERLNFDGISKFGFRASKFLPLPSCLLALFLGSVSSCWASFEHAVIGARPSGMGGAFVALADDPDALFWNPAGLEQISASGFSAYFAQPFGLKDVTLGSMGYVRPTHWGTWGLSLITFGNAVYRENTYGLSYSRSVWRGLSIGATANMFSLRIDRYGSATAYGVDIGALFKMIRGLHGGLCIKNVTKSRLGEVGEPLPGKMSAGLRAYPADELILNAELQKEAAYPIQLHAGQEYRISKHVALRSGLSTNPTDFTGGIGCYIGRYRLDYAFSSHSVLGTTHQASITIRLGRPHENSKPGIR